MKSLFEIFRSTKKRNPIPKSWLGLWTDKNGKQLIIELFKNCQYAVTVMDSKGQPFEIETLDNQIKKTVKLTGRFETDTNGNLILQVEAGSDEIGPTYNLYFVIKDSDQNLRQASNSDSLKEIIIKPKVGMGLYDDLEDDLGVPWAFPLEEFKKINV